MFYLLFRLKTMIAWSELDCFSAGDDEIFDKQPLDPNKKERKQTKFRPKPARFLKPSTNFVDLSKVMMKYPPEGNGISRGLFLMAKKQAISSHILQKHGPKIHFKTLI